MTGLTGNVSRETQEKLYRLTGLVLRWNASVNLVSRDSIAEIDARHIADSAQIAQFLPPDAAHWVDIGSGGGFPGLVVAALLHASHPSVRVTLVESDQRKAVFLRQAARLMGITVAIIANRVERVAPLSADVISARALAPLPQLCAYVQRHLQPQGVALFLKGENYRIEVARAIELGWRFDMTPHQSQTHPDAVILALQNIRQNDRSEQ
jgi:16S rRNA (guanine527-N7)-methyltransferase